MKYFTAEALADESHKLWEEKLKQYKQHLVSLNLQGNIKALSLTCFHDAELLDFNFKPTKNEVTLLLNLDNAWGKVELTYILHNNGIEVNKNGGIDVESPAFRWWLYDEVSKEDGYFTHSVLFTGGVELKFDFVDVKIEDKSDI